MVLDTDLLRVAAMADLRAMEDRRQAAAMAVDRWVVVAVMADLRAMEDRPQADSVLRREDRQASVGRRWVR